MREYFLLYDLVSLVLGVAASSVVMILYLKTRSRRMAAFLWTEFFVTLIVVAVSFDLYTEIAGRPSTLRNILWESIQFSCCGLCASIPRISRLESPARWEIIAARAFTASGIALALGLAAYFLFLNAPTGPFIVLYVLIYVDLSLASLYFAVVSIRSRKKPRLRGELRYYHTALRFTGGAIAVLLPFFIATDFFGWLIPAIDAWLDKGFTLLPAFYILMSLAMLLGSALEILEPAEAAAALPPAAALEPSLQAVAPDPAFIAKFALTRREAEIAPLVLRCLTYEQIGQRLFISPGTVRSHLVHIYAKTGTRNRLELSALIQAESPGGTAPTARPSSSPP